MVHQHGPSSCRSASPVYNWRRTIGKTVGPDGSRLDVKGTIPDLDWVAWQDRKVVIAYDTDAVTKATVRIARAELAAHLRGRGCRRIFTVGFCFGGRNSWLAAAADHGLAGAVGFYGRPGGGRDGTPGPIQLAGELKAPILALQAGADQNITADDNAAFEAALQGAGVEHEVVTYPGAPHSFFDRKQEEFTAASDDAWAKVLAFIEAHS